MNWKKFILAGVIGGVVITAVSLIVGSIITFLFPYNVLELGGMRTVTDPVMMLFFLHPWVLSFAMALVYPYFSKVLEGNYLCKGKKFGVLVWAVASIPSAFLVYSSMDYPVGFTVNSVIGSLLYVLAAGITIAKIMDAK